ncbi:MAG: hypothetical protein KAS67_03730 [Thermoplasmata archaeon]|nr:hypothetical protein [Thermoplasmata archaeon]
MKLSWDDNGQLTLFDSILFFMIMLIASGLFLQMGSMMSGSADLMREQNASEYTDRARLSLMASYIPETTYAHDGDTHLIRDRSVQYLLIEQLRLMKSGIPGANFDFPEDIRDQANLTIDRTYNWAVRASSGSHTITITREYTSYEMSQEDLGIEMGDHIHASTWTTLMFETNDKVDIGLYLWN